MKHRSPQLQIFIAGTLGLLSLFNASVAASPPDVPANHWAARSVQSVTSKRIMNGLPDGKFHGSKPVTRYELAVVLDRFINYIEAGRKPLTTAPAKTNIPISAAAPLPVKTALKHLAGMSFLPPTSPLFRGTGQEYVTAQQLSDALAQVTIRLSDRSLPPSQD